MTVADMPVQSDGIEAGELQRFIFTDVDWALYESVGEKLANRRVFITYYKGKLEVVTVSFMHERISTLLVILIGMLAEELSVPIMSAGMTTLKRMDLADGVEPDSSFYTTHELQMRGKTELELAVDPPPDPAIEVEITHRVGARKSIYRDLGVPEVWVYSSNGLSVLIKRDDAYLAVDASPTFSILSSQDITQLIKAGLNQEQSAFSRMCRMRIKQAVSKP